MTNLQISFKINLINGLGAESFVSLHELKLSNGDLHDLEAILASSYTLYHNYIDKQNVNGAERIVAEAYTKAEKLIKPSFTR